jgi:pyruvate/2-oxoglutarate dehydrogenase complex dihydrolipoamide dehydrogenase (E3) component
MGGNLTGAIEDFDAIVVGAGQAGPPLAAMLAGAGMRVAIVERHLIGGTCLNVGCTPTKTMIASAHVAHVARPRWARVAREHRCGYAAQRAARLVV